MRTRITLVRLMVIRSMMTNRMRLMMTSKMIKRNLPN